MQDQDKISKVDIQRNLITSLVGCAIVGIGGLLGKTLFPDYYLWIIIAVAAVVFIPMFINDPYFLILAFFVFMPFSYIFTHRFGFGALRLAGLFVAVLSIPAILWHQRKLSFEATPLGISIWTFILLAGLSILAIAYTPQTTPFHGALLYAGNGIFYMLLVKFINNFNKLKLLFFVIIGIFVITVAIALIQSFARGGYFRVVGTIQNPNYFSFCLLPSTMICLHMWWGENKFSLKLLFGAIFLLLVVAILLSFSRGMTLALLSSLLIVFIIQKKFLAFVGLLAGIVILVLLVIPEELRLAFSWEGLYHERLLSIQFRFYFVKTALKMFLDYPIFGVGADNFPGMFLQYSTIWPRITEPYPHNTYLSILTGMGILGFIAFLSIIYFTFKNLIYAQRVFKDSKAYEKYWFTTGLLGGLLAYSIAFLSIEVTHHAFVWLLIASSTILRKEAKTLAFLHG